MADEAKDIATFIVEPVGADIYNPDSYMLRKRYQSTETTTSYDDLEAATLFQDISDDFGSAAGDVGCRIYLKNGLYEIFDDAFNNGTLVEWSTETEGDHVTFYMEGETRDGVIIRNANTVEESTRIFLVRCNFYLRNVTIDGADLRVNSTFTGGVEAFGQPVGDPTVLNVRDCHFMRVHGSCCRTDIQAAKMIVEDCLFDQSPGDQGFVDIGVYEMARIVNNVFDKTNGTDTTNNGSSITTAGLGNIFILNNYIKKTHGDMFGGFGISIESNYNNIDNCVISNNYLEDARIFVGASGSWDTDTNNVWVTGNTLYHGGIYVQGPSGGTGTIKNIFLENNQLIDSWRAGFHIDSVTDFVTVRNNFIKNSNLSSITPTGREPLIHLEATNNIICELNRLYMGTNGGDADVSTHGIRYANLANPTIEKNRIINKTASNPSYESVGSHTGSVLISRNL